MPNPKALYAPPLGSFDSQQKAAELVLEQILILIKEHFRKFFSLLAIKEEKEEKANRIEANAKNNKEKGRAHIITNPNSQAADNKLNELIKNFIKNLFDKFNSGSFSLEELNESFKNFAHSVGISKKETTDLIKLIDDSIEASLTAPDTNSSSPETNSSSSVKAPKPEFTPSTKKQKDKNNVLSLALEDLKEKKSSPKLSSYSIEELFYYAFLIHAALKFELKAKQLNKNNSFSTVFFKVDQTQLLINTRNYHFEF